MNRYREEIQNTIACLGDQVGRMQILMRQLADCRDLKEEQLDPETDLAVVCWLEEADDVLGRARVKPRSRRSMS